MGRKTTFAVIVLVILWGTAVAVSAGSAAMKKEQTVYVSAYPHIYMGPRGHIFDLSVTLVIRNTDLKSPISVVSADYYDTNGKLTKRYLAGPKTINPMASLDIHITEKDTGGGIGSNFIVRWKAEKEVNVPIIEAVMIGGKSGQGISFVAQGQEISE